MKLKDLDHPPGEQSTARWRNRVDNRIISAMARIANTRTVFAAFLVSLFGGVIFISLRPGPAGLVLVGLGTLLGALAGIAEMLRERRGL
jgi:hypothetical protein